MQYSNKGSNSNKAGIVTGLFRDKESAEQAYRSLLDKGYTPDEVTVLMSEETRNTHFKGKDNDSELGNKSLEGAGAGSAIGGTLGAIIGAVAAVGASVAIPGVGLVVAGPIVAALTGAGAGGLTGGLIGALIGAGIPEDKAKVYKSGIKEGSIVMGVEPRSEADAEYFESEWETYNAEHLHR
ncbi:hypothetical protein BH23BAC1_BH23BAC1_34690 [soil metagenome]